MVLMLIDVRVIPCCPLLLEPLLAHQTLGDFTPGAPTGIVQCRSVKTEHGSCFLFKNPMNYFLIPFKKIILFEELDARIFFFHTQVIDERRTCAMLLSHHTNSSNPLGDEYYICSLLDSNIYCRVYYVRCLFIPYLARFVKFSSTYRFCPKLVRQVCLKYKKFDSFRKSSFHSYYHSFLLSPFSSKSLLKYSPL